MEKPEIHDDAMRQYYLNQMRCRPIRSDGKAWQRFEAIAYNKERGLTNTEIGYKFSISRSRVAMILFQRKLMIEGAEAREYHGLIRILPQLKMMIDSDK